MVSTARVIVVSIVGGVVITAMVMAVMYLGGAFNSSRNAYCVDENGQVVSSSQCANPTNPGVFLIITSRAYRAGQTVPSSETRIPADDPQARTNAGLPGTGEVPEHVQAPAQQAPVENAPPPGAPEVNDPPPVKPVVPVEPEPVIEVK